MKPKGSKIPDSGWKWNSFFLEMFVILSIIYSEIAKSMWKIIQISLNSIFSMWVSDIRIPPPKIKLLYKKQIVLQVLYIHRYIIYIVLSLSFLLKNLQSQMMKELIYTIKEIEAEYSKQLESSYSPLLWIVN